MSWGGKESVRKQRKSLCLSLPLSRQFIFTELVYNSRNCPQLYQGTFCKPRPSYKDGASVCVCEREVCDKCYLII